MHTIRSLRATTFCVRVALVVALAQPVFADGPPPATLAPPSGSTTEAADSLSARGLAEFDEGAYRAARAPSAGHPRLRKIAIATSLGLAAAALWRESVAADRERDYDNAILPDSAARLRASVRDAERERNVLASLSAAGCMLVVLTFVY
ncbi:MAG: hypothetical protein ACKVU1_09745 [bacterium]